VLGPKTVPKLTRSLLDDGVMTEAQAFEIHVKNPFKTYDIVLEE
jgi:TatD-related deoxyribonuclease